MADFTDLNFKLLVIDKLMYQDETLTPRFDIEAHLRDLGIVRPDQYVDNYVEENGIAYTFLPEARAYFEALEISDELLATVDELLMDGGIDVYVECAPVWDGEDDIFDISSFRDIPLLPNLKRVYGTAPMFPYSDKKLFAELDEHGIAYDF